MTDPILLTPGPLTTAAETRQALLHDWGSWDGDFRALTARVRARLLDIVGAAGTHACVPIQGSGTYAVEAALGTLVPRGGKVLVLSNGAYGRRMVRTCAVIGRAHAVYETPEDAPPDPAAVAARLRADPAITHVGAIHCETGTGLLNPLAAIAAAVAGAGRALIVDAMSTFGSLPLDPVRLPAQAVVASANKALEGVPGFGFVIAERGALAAAAGNAHSLSLDLHDQWAYMERSGQWRFTPPTHVVAALDRALDLHAAEGGTAARGARYARNCAVLVEGMRRLGFTTFLPDALQAPVIVTFHTPRDPAYRFDAFYDALKRRGYIIYPGKTTDLDTFRIGCIGALDEGHMHGVVAAVAAALAELGVTDLTPAGPGGPEAARTAPAMPS